MKVKTQLRLEQEKILHDDSVVKRSQRYNHFYESICHCSRGNCGNYCTSKIGQGSNGSIRICRNRKTHQLVAVKQVKATPRAGHEITLHYLVSKKLKQNVVQILDIFLNTDSRGESWFYVILEYCKDGDMFKLLKSRPNGFPESDIFCMSKQIVDMLNALRLLGIAHCDVKPENILVAYKKNTEDTNKSTETTTATSQITTTSSSFSQELPQLKLADFGFARDVNQPATNSKKQLLMYTPNYVAPEVLMKRDYGLACDTWALGVIMFVMATGNFPDISEIAVPEKEIIQQLRNPKILNNNKEDSPKKINSNNENRTNNDNNYLQLSKPLLDLFQRIFVVDPNCRITIPEIMNHEWWMIMSNKKSRKHQNMLKKQKLKNNNSNNKSSSENTTPSAGCSSADENNNDLKINQGNCSKKNDNSGRNKLKKGEKYTWSESDILKSLALEDSDNGSDKLRSGNKSSRSSRRDRNQNDENDDDSSRSSDS